MQVKDSLTVRLIAIFLIGCGLMVPILMIGLLVSERANRRDHAVSEISGMWSEPQTVSGPILSVPYRCGPPLGPAVKVECQDRFVVQAKTLTIEGSLNPEVRTRSLFSAVVYRTRLKITAVFAPELGGLNPAPTEVFWESGSVNVGLTDPRGVTNAVELESGGVRRNFVRGVVPGIGRATGMRAILTGIRPSAAGEIPVSFEFELNGTRQVDFSMLGDNAVVRLSSAWPHPSFVGIALPSTHTTNKDGFSAEWRTGAFWRIAPASFSGPQAAKPEAASESAVPVSSFGVALITPVDVYQQTERAVKYAVLFIGATFLTAFLWEVTRGVLAHPVQYVFVGFAMCVFYLLLLSGSEHVGFDRAYLAASAATVALLAWYWRWVAGGRARGGVMAVILSGLYGFLYLLLRLEDYALLAGSVGLFLALAAVMYLTRKVNWYELGKPPVQTR